MVSDTLDAVVVTRPVRNNHQRGCLANTGTLCWALAPPRSGVIMLRKR
jgi:hypothetical protein